MTDRRDGGKSAFGDWFSPLEYSLEFAPGHGDLVELRFAFVVQFQGVDGVSIKSQPNEISNLSRKRKYRRVDLVISSVDSSISCLKPNTRAFHVLSALDFRRTVCCGMQDLPTLPWSKDPLQFLLWHLRLEQFRFLSRFSFSLLPA